jgi:AcrR family transcriptional regulator
MNNNDWRTEKKAATRRRIRECALQLFEKNGYDSTTVEEVAEAASVSHMTFFRYFPTKEDVVLSDDYDVLLFEQLQQLSSELTIMERIHGAFKAGLSEMYELDRDTLLVQNKLIANTPVLRARLWENQMNAQQLFVDALKKDTPVTKLYEVGIIVAACLAAATTAVLTWAESDGDSELPELLDQAFSALAHIQEGIN